MSKVEEADERDWAKLHPDVLMVIFDKIGMLEVLLRASKVCRLWRKAARDDPLLWRRIDVRFKYIYYELNHFSATGMYDKALWKITKIAVNFGGNNVQQLSIGDFSDENILESLLEYIAGRATHLKNFTIECSTFHEKMAMTLGKLKQLEELKIVWSYMQSGLVMRAIGAECPQLKRLKLKSPFNRETYSHKIFWKVLGIPQTMLQLEYLQLAVSCISTTNEEVLKILERCPNLEILDLHDSFKIAVKDDDLRARCPRIHTVLPPPRDDIYNDLYVDDADDICEGFEDPYDHIYDNPDDDIYDEFYDDLYVDTYDYLYDAI